MTTGKIMLRLLFYGFLAIVVWSAGRTYLAVRTDRVNTRLSVRMTAGEHETVFSLPSGRYQIQFTDRPNASPAITVPPQHVLPAHIGTRIVRSDGSAILEPTTNEYVTFAIEGSDAFKPQRLLVSITETQECQIYMNLGPGF